MGIGQQVLMNFMGYLHFINVEAKSLSWQSNKKAKSPVQNLLSLASGIQSYKDRNLRDQVSPQVVLNSSDV